MYHFLVPISLDVEWAIIKSLSQMSSSTSTLWGRGHVLQCRRSYKISRGRGGWWASCHFIAPHHFPAPYLQVAIHKIPADSALFEELNLTPFWEARLDAPHLERVPACLRCASGLTSPPLQPGLASSSWRRTSRRVDLSSAGHGGEGH